MFELKMSPDFVSEIWSPSLFTSVFVSDFTRLLFLCRQGRQDADTSV